MGECGVKTLVFSSSAIVYGDPIRLPLTEDHPLSATNPYSYGHSKFRIEEILRDPHRSDVGLAARSSALFQPSGRPCRAA